MFLRASLGERDSACRGLLRTPPTPLAFNSASGGTALPRRTGHMTETNASGWRVSLIHYAAASGETSASQRWGLGGALGCELSWRKRRGVSQRNFPYPIPPSNRRTMPTPALRRPLLAPNYNRAELHPTLPPHPPFPPRCACSDWNVPSQEAPQSVDICYNSPSHTFDTVLNMIGGKNNIGTTFRAMERATNLCHKV